MSKSLLSVLFVLTLFLSGASFASAQESFTTLKNSDIMTMVRANLPTALIIEKINTSSCSFDTFPSVLAEMKYKGVPDEILMAMVEAPHGGRPKPVEQSNPEPRSEVKAVENVGGIILGDRSKTPIMHASLWHRWRKASMDS